MGTSRDYYEKVWSDSDQDGPLTEYMIRAIETKHLIGNKVIDIGCGDGELAEEIRSPGRSVFGLDISLAALKYATRRGVIPFLGDASGTIFPIRDHSVDTVISLENIEHIFDPCRYLAEIYRVLVPGGVLIMSSPNARFIDFSFPFFFRGEAIKTAISEKGYDGGHLHYFTFAELEKIVTETGFEIIKLEGIALRKYPGLKQVLFRVLARIWERKVLEEYYCKGIFLVAAKPNC